MLGVHCSTGCRDPERHLSQHSELKQAPELVFSHEKADILSDRRSAAQYRSRDGPQP